MNELVLDLNLVLVYTFPVICSQATYTNILFSQEHCFVFFKSFPMFGLKISIDRLYELGAAGRICKEIVFRIFEGATFSHRTMTKD